MDEEQAKKWLAAFMSEINNQNNRHSVVPYFYVIRTEKWVAQYEGHDGERNVYCNKDDYGDIVRVFDDENLVNVFKKEERDDFNSNLSDEEIEEWIEDKFDCYPEVKMWEETGCFFTEKDAERHLRLNNYHYSKKAHTYVKSFYRAPDAEKFFKAVGVLCGTELEIK